MAGSWHVISLQKANCPVVLNGINKRKRMEWSNHCSEVPANEPLLKRRSLLKLIQPLFHVTTCQEFIPIILFLRCVKHAIRVFSFSCSFIFALKQFSLQHCLFTLRQNNKSHYWQRFNHIQKNEVSVIRNNPKLKQFLKPKTLLQLSNFA